MKNQELKPLTGDELLNTSGGLHPIGWYIIAQVIEGLWRDCPEK